MKIATIATACVLLLFPARAEDSLDELLKNATPQARELMLVWDKKAERPVDKRHEPPRTLYQGSGFKPPATKEEWQARAKFLREQILVAAGLWPLPGSDERCPLNATVHGKIDRGNYTVEKVFFESYPGFYVTGLLYRPKGKAGPFPGVLCPHGHWAQGRFTVASDAEADKQIKGGWEKDVAAAKNIQQARCANLAQLGCIVFQYDMVGYADAAPKVFPHRATYLGADYELNGLSILGLQLWDSMRALDFLEALADVDKSRLACTGESGGATQTFLMMATDPRLAVAAPVCMISAGDHQGGCVCENTALLRLFTDNVEIAATFAPKPFIHPSATGDWTKDFLEKGFPEIKATYKVFNAEDKVESMRQTAAHNYNMKSREAVYNFFNKHLKLGAPSPIVEAKFEPLTVKEMSVFDEEHSRPANAIDAPRLREYLAATTAKRIDALMPKSEASLQKYREVFGTALTHMCGTWLPVGTQQPKPAAFAEVRRPGLAAAKAFSARVNDAEKIPVVVYVPGTPAFKGDIDATILAVPHGKAALVNNDGSFKEPLASLVKIGMVITVDLFDSGENTASLAGFKSPDRSKEFFAGYNRTVLANRVHDLLTLIGGARTDQIRRLNLIGLGDQGTACLLAAALSNGAISRVAVDADKFDFDQVKDYNDPRFLPSAQRFGGIWPLSALAAPTELFVFNTGKPAVSPWLSAAYKAAQAEEKLKFAESADLKTIVDWITR